MSSVTPYVAVSSPSSSSPVVVRGIGIDAIASKVAGHRTFGFLPEQDLRALMQWTTIRTFPPHEMIFRHGEPGRAVILVLQGYVKLSTTLANGREVVLEILGPGGCVGEVAVLNKGHREADATTLSGCRLLSIDGRQYKQMSIAGNCAIGQRATSESKGPGGGRLGTLGAGTLGESDFATIEVRGTRPTPGWH